MMDITLELTAAANAGAADANAANTIVLDHLTQVSEAPAPAVDVFEAEARERYVPPRFSLRALDDTAIELDILEQTIAAMGGELTPAMEARFDRALEVLTRQADGIGDYRQAWQIEIAALKNEADRLTERRKKAEESLKAWEQRIARYLVRMNRLKVSGSYWSLTVRTNQPSLKVADDTKLPAPYRTEREVTATEVTLDNKQLKADLVAYEEALKAWNAECDRVVERMLADHADDEAIAAALPPAPERPVPETVAHIERSLSLMVK
jgi:hypothetical protein